MTAKKITIHRTLNDGGHWFCCGAGEQFTYRAATELDIYGKRLADLLPLVETYARAKAAEVLHDLADTAQKRGGVPDTVLGADIRARAYELGDAR